MRVLVKVIIVVMVLSATASFALAGKCCPAKLGCRAQKGSKTCGMKECDLMISQLNLTEEQKSTFLRIQEDCSKADATGVKEEWCETMGELLSDEQMEKLSGMCKAKGMTCPLIEDGKKEVAAIKPDHPSAAEHPAATEHPSGTEHPTSAAEHPSAE